MRNVRVPLSRLRSLHTPDRRVARIPAHHHIGVGNIQSARARIRVHEWNGWDHGWSQSSSLLLLFQAFPPVGIIFKHFETQ